MAADRSVTAVLVVRHGESVWNASGRWQGWADPPLSAAGTLHANAVVPDLVPFGFAAVYCSDLDRARSTAAILADGLGLAPPSVDPRLRERDIGEWTGLTDTEIGARWPGEPQAWRAEETDAPPGGETAETAVGRVRAALHDISERSAGVRALVVAHGGVIRALERSLGDADRPLANLAGRWIHVADGELGLGPRFGPAAGSAPTSPL